MLYYKYRNDFHAFGQLQAVYFLINLNGKSCWPASFVLRYLPSR